MSVYVTEQAKRQTYQRTPQGQRRTAVYLVEGATEPEEAANAAGIPADGEAYPDPEGVLENELRVTDVTARPFSGADDWEVTVTWEYPVPDRPTTPQAGDEWWTLRYGPRRITKHTALAQESYGTDARDVGLATGVDDAGIAHGVQAHEGYAELDVTLWKATADVTGTYLSGLLFETPPVNSTGWYGFLAGEVLYGGCEIVSRGEDLTEIRFSFLCKPNLEADDLPDWTDADGNTITMTGGHEGWQVPWTQAGEMKDDATGKVKRFTRGAYKATVYPTDDFSGFGLSGELFPAEGG